MKFTEQTLRELLFDPHTIKELIKNEPPHMAQRRAEIDKLFEGVKPYDEAEVKAGNIHIKTVAEVMADDFHLHCESCPDCSNHIKAMCSEGRRLLNEWAVSFTDSRVN